MLHYNYEVGDTLHHRIGANVTHYTVTDNERSLWVADAANNCLPLPKGGQVYPGDYNGCIAAGKDAEAHYTAQQVALAAIHTPEFQRTERLETAEVQLEVTDREYAVTTLHQPEAAQNIAA